MPLWAAAAVIGACVGATYGSKHFVRAPLKRLLAIVLVVAGLKMIFTWSEIPAESRV